MSIEERDKLLSTLPFWGSLNENERELARRGASFRQYNKGDYIHSCNGSCLGLVLVVSGELRAYIMSEEGREITLFRLRQGSICVLAASCVISQITFDAHISAQEDTRLLIINAPTFLQLKDGNIHVECFLYKLATERFSDVMFAMQQLLFSAFDRRLAAFLTEEAEKSGRPELTMTHEQIARLTGSAREVVSRMLKRFADEGLVALKRGSVTITDQNALRQLGK